jgi:hypothetical protein
MSASYEFTMFIALSMARVMSQSLPCFRTWNPQGESLCHIFRTGADTNIANRIWAFIAKAGHAVLPFATPSLTPFSALLPDRKPFLEGKQKVDASPLRPNTLQRKCRSFGISLLPCFLSYLRDRAQTFTISLVPNLLVRALMLTISFVPSFPVRAQALTISLAPCFFLL